jgi:hypothetical protein
VDPGRDRSLPAITMIYQTVIVIILFITYHVKLYGLCNTIDDLVNNCELFVVRGTQSAHELPNRKLIP